jgi:hypothetical protein
MEMVQDKHGEKWNTLVGKPKEKTTIKPRNRWQINQKES